CAPRAVAALPPPVRPASPRSAPRPCCAPAPPPRSRSAAASARPARPVRRTRRTPRAPHPPHPPHAPRAPSAAHPSARTRCFARSNPPGELEAQNLVRTREVDSNGPFRSTPARCGGTMSGMHERAGQPALAEDLIDPDAVIGAYYDRVPEPDDPAQQVAFGTSGHRGASLDGAFNEAHIIAITQAIVEYRAAAGVDGPLYLGRDTHALSEPAARTALEVLSAAGVEVRIDARDSYTPTPALSHSILRHNGAGTSDGVRTQGPGVADGIVVTPSHNPPRDGGFKYNPPHGGPAGSEATSRIAARANELLHDGVGSVPRVPYERAVDAENVHRHDYLLTYVDDLPNVLDLEAISSSGVRIGADPLGGASVEYWAEIAERHNLDLTVVNQKVDPTWSFMTLDWDGKIRMDCSSPSAMASLVNAMRAEGAPPYDIATGNDADSDRHGIVTPDGGLMNPNHYLAVAIQYLLSHRSTWPGGAAVGKT